MVLSGSLRHESAVGEAVLGPGDVQRLTAGVGVDHAETTTDDDATTRFVQVWLRPRDSGLPASYALSRGALKDAADRLSPLDLGPGCEATLHLGRVAPGGSVTLPDAPLVHVFVATGGGVLRSRHGDAPLEEGDAARLDAAGGARLDVVTGATVLAWAIPAEHRPL